ncbi:TPA: hypothetical protein ACG05V_005435 [Bacillus pacificus]|uniref:hypothetical protein n=1 Tax=Bacillus TaxID=1386 RepID=UPI0029C27757|nr:MULTISPECIES: hypothetical protein [unclassified Bacillus cereus group]MDX5839886.1 hypothetical protein [Bacillus cereus group sp. BfR-BA-01700]MDX5846249.1 hypothetical protein [Bacillus cereus group sp. BfR-BA-01233]MDX5941837.1 hypothetical protein [Bacillus cereus group sp. BfR-BA-00415]
MATAKEKTKEKETKRPKYKQLTLRKKENPLFVEWLDNQSDFSDSIRKLIENHIMRHGTKDMTDPNVVLGMAKDLVLLDQFQHGQVVPTTNQQVQQTQSIQATEEIAATKQEEPEKEVEATIVEEKKESEEKKKTGRKNLNLDNF